MTSGRALPGRSNSILEQDFSELLFLNQIIRSFSFPYVSPYLERPARPSPAPYPPLIAASPQPVCRHGGLTIAPSDLPHPLLEMFHILKNSFPSGGVLAVLIW